MIGGFEAFSIGMAPSRRKGASKAAAAAAAALRQWKVGDLVLAKVKGFPAWPATVYIFLFQFVFLSSTGSLLLYYCFLLASSFV